MGLLTLLGMAEVSTKMLLYGRQETIGAVAQFYVGYFIGCKVMTFTIS